MLKPAILYKKEIEDRSRELFYTDEAMFYNGGLSNVPIYIVEKDEGGTLFQYAIVDSDKLVGYVSYCVDFYASCAYRFGLISFDKGNMTIGLAVKKVIDQLIKKCKLHRIEFRCVGGNPAKRHYDYFCKRYNGRCLELRDVFKDKYGKYCNDYIYEIILERKN